ncbi:MAG: hypothetical protein M3Q30_23805 [Actinomycetota bacterium]|nr:hypothetical protein [Actinomycetota bacterium]
MVDVILVAILVAFFSLAVLFVKACELIIGPDIETARAGAATADDEPAAV